MFELELSRCPICQTSRGLLRRMREVQGQHIVWYECPECASALMWLGGDRWVYQQVGRTDRQYLAKRPLTTVELQALSVANAPATAAPTWTSDEPLLSGDTASEEEEEAEEIAPIPAPAPPPAAITPATAERPKGIPLSLVVAVAIITLLCVVAALAIILTQLQ